LLHILIEKMFAVLESIFVNFAAATDAELVSAITASHRFANEAENELCRRFTPRLRLYGLRHTRNEQSAADLTQQALVLMIETIRAGRVREPEKLASFLLGSCRMLLLDIRRGERRRGGLLNEYARTFSHVAPLEPLDTDHLRNCLQHLPERERSVVMMTFYEEQSSEAVAASLGLTSANARVIRHRALGRLRECMGAA
jgi:RNA polymerase sigma-70 factor, ECF subfamily